jgi:hypothetical protein
MAKMIDTGIVGTVPAILPLPRKGGKRTAGTELREGRIALHAGDDPREAEAFGAALRASFEEFCRREAARPKPDGSHKPQRSRFVEPSRAIHESRLAPKGHGGSRYDYDKADRLSYSVPPIVILSSEGGIPRTFPALGKLPTRKPVAPPAPVKSARKPRQAAQKRRVAPPAPVKAGELAACPRCGRSDFRTANGREWHVANAPDCRRYVNREKHEYREVAA